MRRVLLFFMFFLFFAVVTPRLIVARISGELGAPGNNTEFWDVSVYTVLHGYRKAGLTCSFLPVSYKGHWVYACAGSGVSILLYTNHLARVTSVFMQVPTGQPLVYIPLPLNTPSAVNSYNRQMIGLTSGDIPGGKVKVRLRQHNAEEICNIVNSTVACGFIRLPVINSIQFHNLIPLFDY